MSTMPDAGHEAGHEAEHGGGHGAGPGHGTEHAPHVSCESCGMPIESGRYCAHCTDAHGTLQPFEERFERMVAWQSRRDPSATREELERATRAYLATMPAWRDHPGVRASAAACDGSACRTSRTDVRD